MLPQFPIEGVYIGQPSLLADGRRSSIVKHAHDQPLWLSVQGLAGDKVADKRVHGGIDMAVHHYPSEHYAHWRAAFPEIAFPVGSIGENLATTGLTEENVYWGDVFAWGDALLEVREPRTPCIKINSRYQTEGLTEKLMETGLCGWYYKVLREGMVQVGQALTHQHRPDDAVRLADFWAVQHAHRPDKAALQALIDCTAVTDKWRRRFVQRRDYLSKL